MKRITLFKSLIITSFFITLFLASGCNSVKEIDTKSQKASNSDAQINQISIEISDVSENAKWYKYEKDGKVLSFFVLKGSDGKIRVAFDACYICYPEKKGYRQEGSYMVCNNCDLVFAINGIGTENKVSGGCWPGYLTSKIEGNYVKIEKIDLENGKWRF
ncbi:MAG: hypothetical protein APG12_00683 [Candidatus Methanofastidiosum methylothiophilum]|uniref:Membrane iron-sulfur containing protein FtrD-like domain-containing protein n=1 Tax=Candidatus Methanofastidiosum methylothiophilum TaxID=1705564 RepID=A0A150J098_9EURY|nr:MAG: hypothetical protein APG10_00018 [Candidatus Methanofastidiosum methylthiophilus]KYC48102.1 MAG: hypothetical protein APG11_00570 [Candidatus Methanofastidiosum methylthiophilus]KYC50659.1 MAG: hypothetical protein APG12_00683 [Candidatus Methanofastidiosum methylthiophilus]